MPSLLSSMAAAAASPPAHTLEAHTPAARTLEASADTSRMIASY